MASTEQAGKQHHHGSPAPEAKVVDGGDDELESQGTGGVRPSGVLDSEIELTAPPAVVGSVLTRRARSPQFAPPPGDGDDDGDNSSGGGRHDFDSPRNAARGKKTVPFKQRAKEFARSLLPPLEWVPEYKRNWRLYLQGDLAAGLTVGCMLVPQSMANALLAGLPPIQGLYASTVPLFLYSIFGTSRLQAIGSVALDALLTFAAMGSVLTAAQLDDDEEVVRLALVIAFFVGLLQIAYGFARLGVLANFLSYATMSGFTSAAALIIGMSQLKDTFGITDVPRHTGPASNLRTLYNVLSRLDETNLYTLVLSVASIILLLLLRHYKRSVFNKETASTAGKVLKLVADLSALTVTIFGAVWARIYDASGVLVRSARDESYDTSTAKFVNVVGDLPSGFPSPGIPEIGEYTDSISNVLVGAGVLSIVGFMELYAISKVYSEKEGYTVNASQELIALGSANMGAAFFKGHPVGGSFSRTAVNAAAGAKTLFANFITAVVVSLVLIVLADALYYIPLSALASIIQVSVLNLVKIEDFKEAWRLHKKADFVVMVATFCVTLGWGIQQGIGTGVLLSIIATVKRSAFPNVAILGQVPGTILFRNIEYVPDALTFDGVSILRLDAELYFANSDGFKSTVLEHAATSVAIVLDASIITSVDLQGVKMLKTLVTELQARGIHIYVAQPRNSVRKLLKRSGLWNMIGPNFIFRDLSNAVAAAVEAGHARGRLSARTGTPLCTAELVHTWKGLTAPVLSVDTGAGSGSGAGGAAASPPHMSPEAKDAAGIPEHHDAIAELAHGSVRGPVPIGDHVYRCTSERLQLLAVPAVPAAEAGLHRLDERPLSSSNRTSTQPRASPPRMAGEGTMKDQDPSSSVPTAARGDVIVEVQSEDAATGGGGGGDDSGLRK